MPDVLYDLRASVRTFRRRPFYPLVAVAILTLGLAACLAVFTYVNGFFQSFPGVDSDGLVKIYGVEDDNVYANISYLDFLDYAAADGGFVGIVAEQPYYAASVRRETMTEVAFLAAVTGDYFRVLDVDVAVGRGLVAEDDKPGADPAAVISYAWWQRSFNGDPSVIGQTLFLNYRPFTIVGIAGPAFLGSTSDFRPDVWIPIAPFSDRYVSWTARAERRDVPLVQVFARLEKGVSRERADGKLRATAAGLDEQYPRSTAPRRLNVAAATWISPTNRLAEQQTVRLMIAAAAGLLLLVCANVANLLLSVATGRQREMAMRSALGASRVRLLRQVLVENVLLSATAGAIALAVAVPAASRLGSYFARPSVWGANVPREVSLDWRVVLFAVVASILTGVAAGLLPALRASARNLVDTLKATGGVAGKGPRTIFGKHVPGIHDLLISAQVALAVVLLVVAGLVLRTLNSLGDVDPGYKYDRLVASHISTSSTSVEVAGRDRFFREVADRISEEPWVESATIMQNALLTPHGRMNMRLDGRSDPVELVFSPVKPGFFETLSAPVLRGREFTLGDTLGAPDVAIVNDRLARQFFPGEQAIGRRIWWPSEDAAERMFEIVGVAPDMRAQNFLDEPVPMVYFPYPQHDYPSGSALIIKTTGNPAAAIPLLYRWLREFEPHLAIVNALPYTEVVRGFLYTQRMNAELFSAIAFLALTLAAVGIFSVMSLAVNRRTREIGIRMAIGARRKDIGALIVRRAMIPLALGVVVGLAGSAATTGLVHGLLFGVEPGDPMTVAAGTAVLVTVALAAAFLPARRAATVDPMAALRRE